jgi:hypothetical protein
MEVMAWCFRWSFCPSRGLVSRPSWKTAFHRAGMMSSFLADITSSAAFAKAPSWSRWSRMKVRNYSKTLGDARFQLEIWDWKAQTLSYNTASEFGSSILSRTRFGIVGGDPSGRFADLKKGVVRGLGTGELGFAQTPDSQLRVSWQIATIIQPRLDNCPLDDSRWCH